MALSLPALYTSWSGKPGPREKEFPEEAVLKGSLFFLREEAEWLPLD